MPCRSRLSTMASPPVMRGMCRSFALFARRWHGEQAPESRSAYCVAVQLSENASAHVLKGRPPAPVPMAGRPPGCRCATGAHRVRVPAPCIPHSAARYGVGLRVDQQRIADVVPGERDLLAPRHDTLRPEVAGSPDLLNSASITECRVQQLGIEHALHGGLQPPRHRDVIRIDAPMVVRQFALEIEHMPRAGRTRR